MMHVYVAVCYMVVRRGRYKGKMNWHYIRQKWEWLDGYMVWN